MKVAKRIDHLAISYGTIDHIRGLEGVLRHGLHSRGSNRRSQIYFSTKGELMTRS